MSRICKGIDDDVAVLRNRRLDHLPFVYVSLDATYVHVREAGQVVSTTESANVKIKSIRRVRGGRGQGARLPPGQAAGGAST